MTRSEFIRLSAFAAAAAAWGWDGRAATAGEEIVRHDAPPRNPRPYAGVEWDTCLQIRTTSHGHCETQAMMDAYLKRGFELLTLSNYYPSAPWYPAAEMRKHRYRAHHDFPVTVNNVRMPGPFDWNKIVSGWADELPAAERAELPFDGEGPKVFNPLPPGVIEGPNAEHHSFRHPDTMRTVYGLHLCCPGSVFCSGTFDKRDRFKTHSHGYHFGSGEPWPIAVDRIIAGLVQKDGGGVTINHPTWSKLTYNFPEKLLDHDPRVLGMEVANADGMSEDYWDYVLRSGRQCFGFFVPDWSLWQWCNVLLVKEKTLSACLRAYREGNFYGARVGGGVRFTHISFDGGKLDVRTDRPMRYEVISAQGSILEKSDNGLAFAAPADRRRHVYLRVKATSENRREVLFTQPFML